MSAPHHQTHAGLTDAEWRQWLDAAARGDYAAGQPCQEKARTWLARVLRHSFLRSGDAAVWLATCASVSTQIQLVETSIDDYSGTCALTGQHADLCVVRCHMLEEDGAVRPSVLFTVHRRLLLFLRCLAYSGLAWRHVAAGEPSAAGYHRCCAYVEAVLAWTTGEPGD